MSHLSRLTIGIAVLTTALALSGPAGAVAITGPVTLADFTAGASYGPPAPAHFTEPGPVTVTSGTATSLFAGPNYHNVDSLPRGIFRIRLQMHGPRTRIQRRRLQLHHA